MQKFTHYSLLLIVCTLFSCRVYQQDIMFRLNEEFGESELANAVEQAESNYRLRAGDKLQLEVYTNEGERLIDPNYELSLGNNNQAMQMRNRVWYLVQDDGNVKLPMVGKIKVLGMTVDEAEEVLQKAYDEAYVDTFVKLTVINRRVVVMGAAGGMVVPLENENTSLIEVLALYGGVNMQAKAGNIRLIRGNLKAPEVYEIDLATIAGMQQSIMDIEAGDIIYLEPWRRPWKESIKDIAPVLSLVSSTITIILVLQNL
ncbi:polysaccharide biosynthesis/export family protein [Marinoscillum sp. MHG1-6]|uniref:polysaccharide biosynthesis/export family protein n=1 Tax=Marinoscillum sp. MHG1-6 TaxID=2959627 RepID=UPI002157D1B7|nr:polysaccharide biosynthesis/export family protein [Marinoscillum sp. MHG1-6]